MHIINGNGIHLSLNIKIRVSRNWMRLECNYHFKDIIVSG